MKYIYFFNCITLHYITLHYYYFVISQKLAVMLFRLVGNRNACYISHTYDQICKGLINDYECDMEFNIESEA